MAKKSFKDLIFKFLKKDENLGAYGGVKQNPSKRFKVKFAMSNKPNNIAVAAYQFEKDAEKFKKDIIAKGGKAILTKEEVVDKENLQYMINTLKKRVLTADSEKKKDLLINQTVKILEGR